MHTDLHVRLIRPYLRLTHDLLLPPALFCVCALSPLCSLWKVVVMTTVSCLPPALVKYLHSKYNPSAQSKVNQS